MLRKHQKEFKRTIDGIISGSGIKTIYIHVTPGGGKSIIPIQAGRLIEAGLADALCWIVPRLSLQDQAARGFADPFFKKMLGHGLSIRTSTNEKDPCRGLHGFTTTFQAAGMDETGLLSSEFSRKRYVLILDEFHHVEEKGVWHKAMAPLVEKAAFRVLMTGTLERGDNKKIAFVKYQHTMNGYMSGSEPRLDNGIDSMVIRYTREEALRERSIVPLKFFFHDGEAEYRYAGTLKKIKKLSKAYGNDTAPAIYTALRTDYAFSLLQIGFEHWNKYRRSNHRSKILVITADFKHAKTISEHLKKISVHHGIATSHDSPSAIRTIKDFKRGKVSVLITIAMCYEGFDCPSATHEICLTHIRSKPWIEQMLARVARIDREAGPYESQLGYIFAPDDPLFREIIAQIEEEQAPFLESRKRQALLFSENGSIGRELVVPIGSKIISMSEMQLGEHGPALEEISTPDDIEAALRDRIENHIRAYSFQNRHKPQELNAEVYRHFKKARADMDAGELQQAFDFVKKRFPAGHRRGTQNTRVPTKAVAWNG